jgi:hypothetical protein
MLGGCLYRSGWAKEMDIHWFLICACGDGAIWGGLDM